MKESNVVIAVTTRSGKEVHLKAIRREYARSRRTAYFLQPNKTEKIRLNCEVRELS